MLVRKSIFRQWNFLREQGSNLGLPLQHRHQGNDAEAGSALARSATRLSYLLFILYKNKKKIETYVY